MQSEEQNSEVCLENFWLETCKTFVQRGSEVFERQRASVRCQTVVHDDERPRLPVSSGQDLSVETITNHVWEDTQAKSNVLCGMNTHVHAEGRLSFEGDKFF